MCSKGESAVLRRNGVSNWSEHRKRAWGNYRPDSKNWAELCG